MAKKLNTFVHAVERDEQNNVTRSQVFGPDDTVPSWAQKAITNPDVWAGEDDASDSEEIAEPPRKGPGSGQEAWVRFAESKGVTGTFGSRDDLIAELEKRGKISKG